VDVEPLRDRWQDRDFPVLMAAARYLEEADDDVPGLEELIEATGFERAQVVKALSALDGTFIDASRHDSMGGIWSYDVIGLTERGRRAVGLWPSGEGVDALVTALRQAEDATEDPEERTALRRAGGAVATVSREVMSDILAAVIKSQTGL
jgi:hypothetical protein